MPPGAHAMPADVADGPSPTPHVPTSRVPSMKLTAPISVLSLALRTLNRKAIVVELVKLCAPSSAHQLNWGSAVLYTVCESAPVPTTPSMTSWARANEL